jgi:hypothetical protein
MCVEMVTVSSIRLDEQAALAITSAASGEVGNKET